MSIFDSWYEQGGTGSGDGSGVEYTAGYRAFLERFMAEHAVTHVLDVGCGDWQFSRLIDWGARMYVGVDVVEALTERLREEHGGPRRLFISGDHASFPVPLLLPARGSLAICKDVVMHLPSAEVRRLIANLSVSEHALYAYDLDEGPPVDCERGGYRALDLTAPPFGLKGEIVYRFPRIHNAHKVVLHVQRSGE